MIDTLFVRFIYLSFELMFGLSVHLPVIFASLWKQCVDTVCVFLAMILIICMLICLSVNYSITYEV